MLELPLYFPLSTHITSKYFLPHKRFILKPADGIPLLLCFRIGQFLVPASLKSSFAPSVYTPVSSVNSIYPFRTHVYLTSYYAQYKRKIIPPLFTAEYRRSRGLTPLAFNVETKRNWVDSLFTLWKWCCILYAVIPWNLLHGPESFRFSRNASHFTEHECVHRLHKSLPLIPIVGEVNPFPFFSLMQV
jgi:hypothetical protein